jgi:hypothetical protein
LSLPALNRNLHGGGIHTIEEDIGRRMMRSRRIKSILSNSMEHGLIIEEEEKERTPRSLFCLLADYL